MRSRRTRANTLLHVLARLIVGGGVIPHERCLVAKPHEQYRATLQMTSNWYLVPLLWAVALVAAGAAIFW
jgi:hypothetical protein